MNDGEIIGLVAVLIVGIVLGVLACEINGDVIDEKLLDNVCKNITNNQSAEYQESTGRTVQREGFTCEIKPENPSTTIIIGGDRTNG